MQKLVLFTDSSRWNLPGVRGIYQAFSDDVPDFDEDSPVLFIDRNKHCADASSAVIAIVWEPEDADTYEEEVEILISAELRKFLETADKRVADCGLALHGGTPPALRDEQAKLVKAIQPNCMQKIYSHNNKPPYSLYCDAIAAANTTGFDEKFGRLASCFWSPHDEMHKIVLPMLPEYLSATDGSAFGDAFASVSDAQWRGLGTALSPVQTADQVKFRIAQAMKVIAGKNPGMDNYSLLCRSLSELVSSKKA